jgi:hypothetical protein
MREYLACGNNPTRHIARSAHDVPPSPQVGGMKTADPGILEAMTASCNFTYTSAIHSHYLPLDVVPAKAGTHTLWRPFLTEAVQPSTNH